MFERRQRATQALQFTQQQRNLNANEALPAIPSLAAQLMACHAAPKRQQRVENIEPCDEMNLAFNADDDFED